MAKGKSSASSATRKKHARRAAVTSGDPEPSIPKEKKPKGKEKGKKGKEVRKKVYIPPVKPAPAQPDPLDTLGIAQRISPELLVVLRRLAKKDSITKRRALEELQADWVDKVRTEGHRAHELVEAIPVWFHHVPVLFLHPSRRIRILAVGLHSSLLNLPSPMPDQLLFFIREVANSDQAELLLGAWLMTAYDVDRQLSSYARQSWDKFVSVARSLSTEHPPVPGQTPVESAKKLKLELDFASFAGIWGFIQRIILDPGGIYLSANPSQSVAPSPPPPRRGRGRVPPPPRRDEESGTRSRGEDEEENELDRNARLRISAFGAAEWVLNTLSAVSREQKQIEEFIAPLGNVALWTALYHGQTAPFAPAEIQSFGWAQPVVRKCAWGLLQALLSTCKLHLKSLLPALSNAVLRSTWVEPDPNVRNAMWKPLLIFLKDFPNAWEVEAASDSDSDSEDSESEDEDEDTEKEQKLRNTTAPPTPRAYPEFLQFLELGCNGSPLQGYPAVLVVLSTIPPSIIAPVQPPVPSLMNSFWAAIDGRALSGLDRTEASLAFLTSLLECTIFLVRRLLNDPSASVLSEGSPSETVHILVNDQMIRVWEEISTNRLKVDTMKASEELTKALGALHRTDPRLFDSAWDSLLASVRKQLDISNEALPALIPTALRTFTERFEQGSRPSHIANELITEVLQSIVSHLGNILEKNEKPNSEYLDSLLAVIDSFGSQLFEDSELTQAIDDTVVEYTSQILAISPRLLFLYFALRANEELCTTLWYKILQSVTEDTDAAKLTIPSLLDAVENGSVPSYLRPKANELDKTVSLLLAEALTKYQANDTLDMVRRILEQSQYLISKDSYRGLVVSISETFCAHTENALHENLTLPLETFSAPLTLLNAVITTHGLDNLPDSCATSLFPNVFLLAYLVPRYRTMADSQKNAAEALWTLWLQKTTDDDKKTVAGIIKANVRDMLSDCFACQASHLVQLVTSRAPGLDVEVAEDIFPGTNDLNAMLDALPSSPIDPSMAVLDPLILPGDYDQEASQSVVDTSEYSSYARIVSAMLLYFSEDRHAAKQNAWVLRHFLALAQYADELLQIPSVQSAVFGPKVSMTELQDLKVRVHQVMAYLLSGSATDGWLPTLLGGLSTGKRSPSYDSVAHLLHDIVLDQAGRDTIRESRILHGLLQHILSSASKQDADQLILIARKVESKAPHIALSIVCSVTRYCPEPVRLDRYRNELAAGLLGIPASKANTDGLWSLRRLAAVAPDTESDVIFLPTTRAVNLMKACQQWITSDEDIDEEVELEITAVFTHLAPILQNVPGAHWDFIFDIMENNLEAASMDDPSTLTGLARTLKLFDVIQDLTSTNKSLRSAWQEREHTQLSMIRDLIARKPEKERKSGPLSQCRELAIAIIQDLPDALIVKETLPQMCHLVTDSSQDVQRMAYHMLREAAAKHTEHVVVEAAVDTDAVIKPELPTELIDILQRTIELLDEGEDMDGQHSFGNLLTWMLIFDLFTNASLKVKSSYIEHLQRLNLISEHFLPQVLNILGLYGGVTKAFKLDIWAVDEFYLDYYSSESPHSLQLLAAHLYFRALLTVPSLFRSWLLDCRDRQLSTAVTSYTSSYFSPAIIRTELAQVKDPAAADLVDENMKVKVASAINEVTASYAVDEYQLELKITLPADWPLHSIEIQDKRIGVSEDRWRAWILGVRQILTFRSGSIVDGLSFFKKNVASHFEGQTECAICYSMISATDSSLPKKPCKTCKNRFHAGCLYKWFSTSHSSSCPLCRSEIMN